MIIVKKYYSCALREMHMVLFKLYSSLMIAAELMSHIFNLDANFN
jgi:hypothetical protein